MFDRGDGVLFCTNHIANSWIQKGSHTRLELTHEEARVWLSKGQWIIRKQNINTHTQLLCVFV